MTFFSEGSEEDEGTAGCCSCQTRRLLLSESVACSAPLSRFHSDSVPPSCSVASSSGRDEDAVEEGEVEEEEEEGPLGICWMAITADWSSEGQESWHTGTSLSKRVGSVPPSSSAVALTPYASASSSAGVVLWLPAEVETCDGGCGCALRNGECGNCEACELLACFACDCCPLVEPEGP